jgi:succinyl-diaminopimelate desuccinylase
MTEAADPVALARALIRCRSVTPADDGALGVLEQALQPLGFACRRLVFEDAESSPVGNLHARLGSARPNLAFAGHTDVVPPGDAAAWRADPFGAELIDGQLFGRGAVDMKGAIACFVAACARLLAAHRPAGSISLLITGDEEGPAINGTPKLLRWLAEQGEALDGCLVGEPTNPGRLGEMIKIGRRGSLTGHLTVTGVQGHSAYPERADNPIPRLLAMLQAISAPLDQGSANFQPSTLAITSVDVGNPAANVIPREARAVFNIRFNDCHDAASLEAWLRARLDGVGGRYSLALKSSGDAFLTPAGPLTRQLQAVIEEQLGIVPELSTSGGTSDARFIKDVCPVVEFGLVGQTMHQTDERVALADLEGLTRVYHAFLLRYFGLA